MANLTKAVLDMASLMDRMETDDFSVENHDLSAIIVNSAHLLVEAIFHMAKEDNEDITQLIVEALNIGATLADLDIELTNTTQSIH